MDKEIADEIIACLPEGRTFFHYFKDRYALILLSRVVGSGVTVAELKRSPYAGLLQKQPVKEALAGAGAGAGVVTAQLLDNWWPVTVEPFLLTLATWGSQRGCDRSWCQTTRSGFNLVLQLNFCRKHDEQYQRLLKPSTHDVFYYDLHPVLKPGRRKQNRETLAWARIDLDLASGEALIEEIQSDWVSYARQAQRRIAHCRRNNQEHPVLYGIRGSADALATYMGEVLQPYAKLWDEAMLAAAILFIREELGLGTIYYHSFETGAALKGMGDCTPPKSLYTTLPRRFCFDRTTRAPGFLGERKIVRKALRKTRDPYWFRLQL